MNDHTMHPAAAIVAGAELVQPAPGAVKPAQSPRLADRRVVAPEAQAKAAGLDPRIIYAHAALANSAPSPVDSTETRIRALEMRIAELEKTANASRNDS